MFLGKAYITVPYEAITERKAQQRYGSLLDNLAFNSKNELLRESREESDKAFLKRISEEFCEECLSKDHV